MKLKISELKPNPFKKQISNGELSREQIDKVKANIKKLGFFGSLPVFKKGETYHLINGHHRLQALKEFYGKDYDVKVELENYNEDQVFRGMVIENLTQRGKEFDETSENVQAVEDYLKGHQEILKDVRTGSGDSPRPRNWEQGRRNDLKDEITANDISEWIDEASGKVISKDVVIDYMNINHKLDKKLKDQVEKKHDKTSEERGEGINFTQAVLLSRVEDKSEQKELAKVLKETREQRVREQGKLITQYKDAPEEVKEQIKKGAVDLADIDLALTQHNLREKKKNRIDVIDISKKIDGLIDRLSFSITESESNLKGTIKDIAVLSKYVKEMSEKQKARIGFKLKNFSNILSQVSNLTREIEKRI